MSEETEYDPCPFCDADNAFLSTDGFIECPWCGARTRDNWNDRPLEHALTAQVAEARAEQLRLQDEVDAARAEIKNMGDDLVTYRNEFDKMRMKLAAAPKWVPVEQFYYEPDTVYTVWGKIDASENARDFEGAWLECRWMRRGSPVAEVTHVLVTPTLPTEDAS